MFYKILYLIFFSTGNMNEHKEQRERQQRKPDLNNILNDQNYLLFHDLDFNLSNYLAQGQL